MSNPMVPRFPRGFLLADRPVDPPSAFIPGPILEHFWVHPWTNIQVAGDRDLFVIVIGHPAPTRPEQGADSSAALFAALQIGEGAFLSELGDLSGRYAVLFGAPGNLRVVTDAAGMQSVFYSITGGVIASHAVLVEQAIGGQIAHSNLPYRYGYPGNRTPYARTKILTPNTYYWMTAHLVHRFWPIFTPAPNTVDQAAEVLLERSATALHAMSEGRTVRLTLTAGLDSRAVLAIALHAGIDFVTYTFGDANTAKIDPAIGVELAKQFGLEHKWLRKRSNTPGLKKSLGESIYSFHHASWVGALREYFQSPNDLSVIGNLLEIGRNKYDAARREGVSPPDTAEAMVGLQYRYLGSGTSRRVATYGIEKYWHEAAAGFQEFIDDTGYQMALRSLDPFDLFYWEHRMSTWQGVASGERDFYAVPFVPFNSRSIFETMLGVPAVDRNADATVYRMIEMVDPALLSVPVNPKHWRAVVD